MPLVLTTPYKNVYSPIQFQAGIVPVELELEQFGSTSYAPSVVQPELELTAFGGTLYAEGVVTVELALDETHLDPDTANSDLTITNNDLTAETNDSLSGWDSVLANIPRGTGKWYWEITLDDNSEVFGTERHRHGIAVAGLTGFDDEYIGQRSSTYGHGTGYSEPSTIVNPPLPACYYVDGTAYGSGGTGDTGGGSPFDEPGDCLDAYGDGDIMMVAVDLDANKLWFGRNGTWNQGGNPGAGTGANMTINSGTYYPAFSVYRNTVSDGSSRAQFTVNFGPTSGGSFTYSIPTGFGPW